MEDSAILSGELLHKRWQVLRPAGEPGPGLLIAVPQTLQTSGLWLSIGLVLITYICKGGNWDDNLVNWDGKLE